MALFKKKESMFGSVGAEIRREQRMEEARERKRRAAEVREAKRQRHLASLRKKTEVNRAEAGYYESVSRKRKARANTVKTLFGGGKKSAFGKIKRRKR